MREVIGLWKKQDSGTYLTPRGQLATRRELVREAVATFKEAIYREGKRPRVSFSTLSQGFDFIRGAINGNRGCL